MSKSQNLMIMAGCSLALAGVVGAGFPHVRAALERADEFRARLPEAQAQFGACARAAVPQGDSVSTYFQAGPMGDSEFGVSTSKAIAGGLQTVAVHGRDGDVQRVTESFVLYGQANGTLHFLSGRGGAVYVEGRVETLQAGSQQARQADAVTACARAALDYLG